MSRRTTVTFNDHDQGVIASVSDPDRAEWAVLVEAAAEKGITLKPGATEAAIVRALVHTGADALRERALECGYAELADLWPEVHDAAETRERRRRYAHRVDRVAEA
ncbi:MAG: hypothetical protein JWM45_2728 [Pseudonocardiales bacterium]|jgi:hypothetical protein|nr:hypothetical protein [Pseudonocardiales bacterium]